jgi:hypothetical protein
MRRLTMCCGACWKRTEICRRPSVGVALLQSPRIMATWIATMTRREREREWVCVRWWCADLRDPDLPLPPPPPPRPRPRHLDARGARALALASFRVAATSAASDAARRVLRAARCVDACSRVESTRVPQCATRVRASRAACATRCGARAARSESQCLAGKRRLCQRSPSRAPCGAARRRAVTTRTRCLTRATLASARRARARVPERCRDARTRVPPSATRRRCCRQLFSPRPSVAAAPTCNSH